VVEGVYHADPHHGNVLLTEDGRLALLDFGLLGRLDEDTRTGLTLLLLALAQNRADDVAELVFSLALTSTRSDQAGFVQDVRRKLPASTTVRSSRSRRETPLPTCSGPRSGATSRCPRPSRWWARRSRRRTRSHGSSTRSSIRSG
jgi:hypothetical protein